tara:strand:- start:1508 stop:2287 length:780 start_codon:yes stop_codon:yes gene_type:complete
VRTEVRNFLKPWWLLSHLVVIALLAATVNLGLWQIRRLQARRDHNRVVAERSLVPPTPISEAFSTLNSGVPPDDLRHTRIRMDGAWLRDAEVVLVNRSMGGGPGVHVVTLFQIDTAYPWAGVAVDRGFVARSLYKEGDVADWSPAGEPGDQLVLKGTLDVFRSGERGHDLEVDRLDRDALESRWEVSLAPMWVRLEEAVGMKDWPVAVPVSDLGEGPHLSYAVQWFVFTAIGLVGYPLVLVRLVRRGDETAPMPEDDPL